MSTSPNVPPESRSLPLPTGDPYAAWRCPDYRFYSVGWFLLAFSKQVETLAVGVYLYDRTKDAMALGWIGLIQAMPVLLLAIFAGQMADRFDRRRIILIMTTVGTIVSVGLYWAALHQMAVGWIYLLLGIGAISQALGSPARSSLLPQVVPAELFSNAVTWNSSIFQIASMTGPAIGGLILGAEKNAPAAFGAVCLFRLLSVAAIALVRSRSPDRTGESISVESLLAGIRFVARTKLILATISLDLFAVLLGGATYLLPIVAEDILKVDTRALGVLRSSEAIGAVVMGLLMAHLPPMRHAGRAMLWAVAGFGAATTVLGISTCYWLSVAMMFLLGALDNISVVVRHTLVQTLTPDAMRGRVSAVNNVFIVASNDLGGLESGFVAGLVGAPFSIISGGIGAILAVLGAAWMWPQILALGSLTDLRPAEAEVPEEKPKEG